MYPRPARGGLSHYSLVPCLTLIVVGMPGNGGFRQGGRVVHAVARHGDNASLSHDAREPGVRTHFVSTHDPRAGAVDGPSDSTRPRTSGSCARVRGSARPRPLPRPAVVSFRKRGNCPVPLGESAGASDTCRSRRRPFARQRAALAHSNPGGIPDTSRRWPRTSPCTPSGRSKPAAAQLAGLHAHLVLYFPNAAHALCHFHGFVDLRLARDKPAQLDHGFVGLHLDIQAFHVGRLK